MLVAYFLSDLYCFLFNNIGVVCRHWSLRWYNCTRLHIMYQAMTMLLSSLFSLQLRKYVFGCGFMKDHKWGLGYTAHMEAVEKWIRPHQQMMRCRIKLSLSIVQQSTDWNKGVWILFRISESEPLLSEKGINITMKHPSVRLQHAKQSAEMWAVSGIKWENNGWGRVKTLLGDYKANSEGYGSHAGVKERKSNYIMHCYRVEPHNSNFSNS